MQVISVKRIRPAVAMQMSAPAGASYATLHAQGANVRYTTNGDDPTVKGTELESGSTHVLDSGDFGNLQVVELSAGAVVSAVFIGA